MGGHFLSPIYDTIQTWELVDLQTGSTKYYVINGHSFATNEWMGGAANIPFSQVDENIFNVVGSKGN